MTETTKPVRRLIDMKKLKKMRDNGFSGVEIARKLGFTKGAVSRALKRLDAMEAPSAVSETVGVTHRLDAMTQLAEINRLIRLELDYIEKHLETAPKRSRKSWQLLKLQHTAEIRKQLALLLKIAETMHSAQQVETFQREVLKAIGEVDPNVRHKIIRNIQKRRTLRSTLDFN